MRFISSRWSEELFNILYSLLSSIACNALTSNSTALRMLRKAVLKQAVFYQAVLQETVFLCLKSTLAGIDGCCIGWQKCRLCNSVAFRRY